MRTRQHRGAKRGQDVSDPEMDIGPCCVCQKVDTRNALGVERTVRNVMCLPHLAPVPGSGWGCAVCRLPANGALAVVCDACLMAYRGTGMPFVDVCAGFLREKQRHPFASLSDTVFEHNLRLHTGFLEDGNAGEGESDGR